MSRSVLREGAGPRPAPLSRSAGAVALSDRGGRRAAAMEETRLGSGIHVLSERIAGVRSVAVGVWVRRGAAHERPEDSGISHLLEHMVFKGTGRRSAEEIASAIEGLGGSLDAYTSREHTSYQARILDEHLGEAMDVLADIVVDPALRDGDLELEREVVLEEIAQVEDTPDDLVFELHGERLWEGHPYGWSILGTEGSVGSIEGERLRALHREQYVAANLVVAAAGNVDHAVLVDRAEKHFGRLPVGARTPPVADPPPTRTGVERVDRASAQTHIVFGSDGPPHASDDRHAVTLLSAALGGGMSSRLFQRVREELGLCYSIFSYQSFYSRAGALGVYVGTRPSTADEAAEAVRVELARVADEGLPADELARIKRQVEGQIMLSLESTAARMYRLASFALHEEPFEDLDELLAHIDAVTADDIRRVAHRYYHPDRQLELRLGPAA